MPLTFPGNRPGRWRRILVIKLRYIGDTVLTLPLINALARGLPRAALHMLVNRESAPVLAGNPHLRRIWRFTPAHRRPAGFFKLVCQLRAQRYDAVIDLTNNDRSALLSFLSGARWRMGFWRDRFLYQRLFYNQMVPSVLGTGHAVDHHLKVACFLGLAVPDIHPWIPVTPAAIARLAPKLARQGLSRQRPFVILHPGARRPYKSWPPARFARLADRIIARTGVQVAFSGGPGDRATIRDISKQMAHPAVDLGGVLSLEELPALIRQAVCLVGNDSGPIHIATAVNTPAIALFGPTEPAVWGPRRDPDRCFEVALACRPCGHGHERCYRGADYCMGRIPLEAVWEAVAETIQRKTDTL